MFDPEEPGRTLTPEQEAQLRRLLADARHTDPMPDDVVARLDRVLSGLAEEPVRSATVVRLAERRRTATRWLVAAAAVVVLGVGGSQLLDGLGGVGMDATSSADEEPAAESAEEPRDGAATGDSSPGGEAEPQESSDPRRLAKVRVEAFADDTEALRDGVTASDYDLPNASRADDFAELADVVCPTGAWGAGRYVAVRYAGDPGWIVFRRPQGDTQVADLFLCGSELASRSLTLPYP
jgi:hypothetical protein